MRRRPSITNVAMDPSRASLVSSLCAGLRITLGDMKLLFLYACLLPAFVATERQDPRLIILVIVSVILTVGGAKMAYASKAPKLVKRLRKQEEVFPLIRRITGAALIGTAVYLIASS